MNQHLLWCAVSICIMVAGAGFYLLFVAHQNSRTIILLDDGQLSGAAQRRLYQRLQQLVQEANSLPTIRQKLQEEFPTLRTISFNTFSPSTLKCHVVFDQPYVLVQRQNTTPLLLSRHGFYTAPSMYHAPVVHDLPSVMVGSQNFSAGDQQALYQRLQTLPENFLSTNALRWMGPTEIILSARDESMHACIVTAWTPYTSLVEQQIALVREKIAQKKNMSSSKRHVPKKWNIDIRFKDQIITKQAPSLFGDIGGK